MSKERAAIFDGQVFQSTAWDRGMGKYSLNLLAALHKEAVFAGRQVYIVFAKGLTLPVEAKETIQKACPGAVLDFIDLRVPKVLPGEDIRPLQQANKKILTAYVSDLGAVGADFMILSLLIDQYVTAFPDNVHKILLFYDLIPLQYSDRYGKMWSYPNYLRRFKTIFETDTILTISQTVADDLAVYTGIDQSFIQNIDGGAIERGHLTSAKPDLNLPDGFILMPSGNDLRKNNFRAIQGFEEFRVASGKEDLALVITSHFDDKTRAELGELSRNVIFTGNVTEPELKWLYENTKALLFVSEYEGLGLPILEAAEVDKPIVCSNLTVFNEMSETAFYYADQFNPSSIANGLEMALAQDGFAAKRKQYPGILKKYTWKHTAQKTISMMTADRSAAPKQKPRIAVFAPTPNGYSAIGKVVMLNHHALNQQFDIDYYLEEGRSGNAFTRQGFLHSVATVYPSGHFNAVEYAKYDAVIYHIGNSEYHVDSIKNALHLPGYLIIHDTKLKQAFEDVLAQYAYMSPERVAAEQKLDELTGAQKTSYLTSLANASLGVVVHSDYARSAVKELPVDTGIQKINLPAATPQLKRLKLGSRFNVGFAGIIHKAKGLDLIDEILASPDFHNIDLHIFGVPLVEPGVLERLEAFSNVKIQKNLTDFEFETLLSEMDAVVSYRPNYNGETSLTVVEALRHGVVPIVRNIGWFSELPDAVVSKVESERGVVEVLKQLIGDDDLLYEKKLAAKKYAQDMHTYKKYAQDMHKLIEKESKNKVSQSVSTALRNKDSKESIARLMSDIGSKKKAH